MNTRHNRPVAEQSKDDSVILERLGNPRIPKF